MPYCPNCKTEYRDGFKKCADCDIELVAELPIQAKESSDKKVKRGCVITFLVVYVLTVLVFIFLLRNSSAELARANKNLDIMAKRAADSIAEVDKLKQENANLKRQLQSSDSSINQGSGLLPNTDAFGVEDVIIVEKLEYKNFNYFNYKGRAAQIKITIKNLTGNNFPVNTRNFKAITNQQRTVPISINILLSYEREINSKVGFDLVELAPDTKADGTIFFELKGGETIQTLMYDDLKIPIKQ